VEAGKTNEAMITMRALFLRYVAQEGNDSSGDGTESAPFATVGRALEAIRAAYAADWPGKGGESPDPARIVIHGTVSETGGSDGMIEIRDRAMYAAYPPIILAGKGGGDEAGVLDASGLAYGNRVLYVRRADLTLDEGLTLTGGAVSDDAFGGGGVCVSGGRFTMNGGTISNNTIIAATGEALGGGVYVTGGSFVMEGGTIRDNETNNSGGKAYGGGVYVTGGSLVVEGGTIRDNTVTSFSDNACGGGVYVTGGSFTMNGGTISDNTNNGHGEAVGGGVYVTGGSFTMHGGTISDNTVTAATDYAAGGGVRVRDGSFTMSGTAVISGNTVTTHADATINKDNAAGGGVCVTGTGASFTMEGGTISGNKAIATNTNAFGGGVDVQGSFTMEGGRISGNEAKANAITVTTVTDSGVSITFGHASGGGVYVEDGTFTMKNNAEISGNEATATAGNAFGGGVNLNNTDSGTSTFTMEGGTISGNKANGTTNASGGGVYVQDGTFTMKNNAEISGNEATATKANGKAFGGGVDVHSPFTMEGGTISGNKANGTTEASGGGVYVQDGTFTMKNNAEISGNEATATAGNVFGGGVKLSIHNSNETHTYTMEGGRINGNKAIATGGNAYGGGIRLDKTSSGTGTGTATFTMSGTAVISGNKATGTTYAYGGGVSVQNVTFTKTGGTIHGGEPEAADNKNTVAASTSSGHAAYVYHTMTSKKRDATAGTGVNLAYTPPSAFTGGWD
jgi:hypothetical protein